MTLPFAEVQKPNVAMGIVYGVAAAGIVGGGIWWAIVFFAHIQFIYGALGVGALIGYGVLEGIRIPGKSAAVIAGVIAVLTVLMSEYFIVRSLGVQELRKSGTTGSIPVWLGVGPFPRHRRQHRSRHRARRRLPSNHARVKFGSAVDRWAL